jgi:hypothetical protein
LCAALVAGESNQRTFAIGTNDFLLDGNKFQIRCGEIHAARVPMEYWRHRLQMAKAMGLNTVCAYLFWNMHEPLIRSAPIQFLKPKRLIETRADDFLKP